MWWQQAATLHVTTALVCQLKVGMNVASLLVSVNVQKTGATGGR